MDYWKTNSEEVSPTATSFFFGERRAVLGWGLSFVLYGQSMKSCGTLWDLSLDQRDRSLPDNFWLLKASAPSWAAKFLCTLPWPTYTCTYTELHRKNLEASIQSEMTWHLSGKGIPFSCGVSLVFVQITLQLSVVHFVVEWAKPFARNCYFNFGSRQYTHALTRYWMVPFAFSIFAKWHPSRFRISS